MSRASRRRPSEVVDGGDDDDKDRDENRRRLNKVRRPRRRIIADDRRAASWRAHFSWRLQCDSPLESCSGGGPCSRPRWENCAGRRRAPEPEQLPTLFPRPQIDPSKLSGRRCKSATRRHQPADVYLICPLILALSIALLALIGPSECQPSSSSSSSSSSLVAGVSGKQAGPNLLPPHAQTAPGERQRRQLLHAPAATANGPPIKRDRQIIQSLQANPSPPFVLNGLHQSSHQSGHLHHQQQPSSDAPKLIPLSALDRYQEGADLRLFCSASAPSSAGRLHFEWRKNQNELLLSRPQAPPSAVDSQRGHTDDDPPELEESGGGGRVRISMMDESASVLRIKQLEADDSGNYTCLVRNQHGFDSSTVRVSVMVKLKWIAEPPGEVRVRAGKFIQLECDASGQPAPLISWTSLKDHQTINSKVLRMDRVSVNDSGLYECRASNSAGPGATAPLHKVVRLIVNGKYG